MDENRAIGKGSDHLAYMATDLKRFQCLTTGHAIILGRKTLLTCPRSAPLKNRRNMILTRNQDFQVEGAEVFHSVEDLLPKLPADAFVVGGEEVYRQLLPYCKEAYVTKVHEGFEADRHFPNLDEDDAWQIVEEEGPFEHEGHPYSYLRYERR